MDDAEATERFKALRSEIRDLHDEVEKLRKRKANGDDVEHLVAKLGALETEVRTKFGSLQSQNGEIQNSLKTLLENVNLIKDDLSHQKREVNTLQETNKGNVWARIPVVAYMFMAVGCFAILQLGLDKWAEIRKAVP